MRTQPDRRGWWIVAACILVTAVGNALGLYGAGVYLQAGVATRGWRNEIASGAISLFYLASAIAAFPVVRTIARSGPRRVIGIGVMLLAVGTVAIGASLLFGVTIAHVTTLAPLVVRRESGAAPVAAAVGPVAAAIQLAAALGPGVYGVLRHACGGYRPALLAIAALDIVAALVLLAGRIHPGRPNQGAPTPCSS